MRIACVEGSIFVVFNMASVCLVLIGLQAHCSEVGSNVRESTIYVSFRHRWKTEDVLEWTDATGSFVMSVCRRGAYGTGFFRGVYVVRVYMQSTMCRRQVNLLLPNNDESQCCLSTLKYTLLILISLYLKYKHTLFHK